MNKVIAREDKSSDGSNLIDEIIRLSDFTFDRLPMLDIIGQRLVDNVSVSFSDLTNAVCEASLISLDYVPFGQIVEGWRMPVLLAVGSGQPFDDNILLAIDRTLLFASIELMLGGRAKEVDKDKTDPFTPIEIGFGERISASIFAELQRALSVVGTSSLELVRVETDPEDASVAKSTSLCARIKCAITIAGHVGHLEVVIPYDALETIRPDLGKIYFGNRAEDQSTWQGLITGQIKRAHIDLEVVLAQETIPLQRIMSWQPGDTINFGIEEGEPATLISADAPMFKVSLGKRNNGFVAVQITEELKQVEKSENDGSDN